MFHECMLPLAQATENNENFSVIMFDQNQDSKAGLKCFWEKPRWDRLVKQLWF